MATAALVAVATPVYNELALTCATVQKSEAELLLLLVVVAVEVEELSSL